MRIVDDDGNIFGKINALDALVVLLVLAVVAAGAAFVLSTDEQSTPDQELADRPINTTTEITFEITGVEPYVADAIPDGETDSDRIAGVEDKSVDPTQVIVEDQNGDLHERTHPRQKTVTLQLTLNTTTTEDDDILFEDEPLEIGRGLTLDFGHVTADGTVIDIAADE